MDIFLLRNLIKCIRCDVYIMWVDRKFNSMFIFFKKVLLILSIKFKFKFRGGGKEFYIFNFFLMFCK